MRRRIDRSHGFQPIRVPNTFSQTSVPLPFIQATCRSAVWSWLQRWIWCIVYRRSNHLSRSVPGASLSRNHCARDI